MASDIAQVMPDFVLSFQCGFHPKSCDGIEIGRNDVSKT